MRVSRTTSTSTGTDRPRRYTRPVRTTVVCLPAEAPISALTERATASIQANGLATSGVLPHFRSRTRRVSKLIDLWQGLTSGGPVRLLDLDGTRARAACDAAGDWLLWNDVVARLRPAQPFWSFLDRHRADERRYPLAKAQADYQAQPQILAMMAHNAIPGRRQLHTAELEAFQAGYGTYVNLAWLAAVPGDGFVPAPGQLLTPRSQRLADQLAYLHQANAHLARLSRDAHLVAVASPA
jgi:hypothetical protein